MNSDKNWYKNHGKMNLKSNHGISSEGLGHPHRCGCANIISKKWKYTETQRNMGHHEAHLHHPNSRRRGGQRRLTGRRAGAAPCAPRRSTRCSSSRPPRAATERQLRRRRRRADDPLPMLFLARPTRAAGAPPHAADGAADTGAPHVRTRWWSSCPITKPVRAAG